MHVAFLFSAAHIDLLPVELHVAFLKLAHLLDFVKVDDEALLQVVELPDALSAKDGGMLGAIEVLDPLVVLLAQVGLDVLVLREVFGLQTLIEVDGGQQRVLRHDLVQNVEVEWQFVN